MSPPIELKIAYIGGGSRQWARKLMFDLALSPDLTGCVALYDIDGESARLNERLGNWLHGSGQPGVVSQWRYEVTDTPEGCPVRRGLRRRLDPAGHAGGDGRGDRHRRAARHVLPSWRYDRRARACARTARRHHLRGSRPRGLRDVPGGLDRQLHQPDDDLHAHADAGGARAQGVWLLPRGLLQPTHACLPGREVHGLSLPLPPAGKSGSTYSGSITSRGSIGPPTARSTCCRSFAGIWPSRASFEPTPARRWRAGTTGSRSVDQVKFELFRRYGILAAAGDRHLVEFMPGFTRSPDELFRWGVIRTPVSYRIGRWQDAPPATVDLIEGRDAACARRLRGRGRCADAGVTGPGRFGDQCERRESRADCQPAAARRGGDERAVQPRSMCSRWSPAPCRRGYRRSSRDT